MIVVSDQSNCGKPASPSHLSRCYYSGPRVTMLLEVHIRCGPWSSCMSSCPVGEMNRRARPDAGSASGRGLEALNLKELLTSK